MTTDSKATTNDRTATTEDPDRAQHHATDRTTTPRHPDLAVILPGPSGPTGKIDKRARRWSGGWAS